ncbi:MAG: divergent polysaccharide deacetylase family protein [Candidatus Baltobacteraceae bacterium]
MPKSSLRRRRRSSGNIVVPILLLAVAAFATWVLFRPMHAPKPRSHATPVAVSTETPTIETPSPEPSIVASPESSASAIESPSPEASLPAIPPKIGNPNAPKLALIIDDCGQWIATERGFVALDVPLTVSVLPDVAYTATIAREADEAGKGVMLHLPMETLSGMNPGPGEITTEMTDAQIARQVESDLAQVPLATGVNNHEGSKASADPRVMRDVLRAIVKHGNLFFIDSKTNSRSIAEQTAVEAGVPTAARDVFLDNKEDVAYSEMQLREAADIAKRTGSAIAIGHPRATTLAAVRALIPELRADGIEFVLAQTLTH